MKNGKGSVIFFGFVFLKGSVILFGFFLNGVSKKTEKKRSAIHYSCLRWSYSNGPVD